MPVIVEMQEQGRIMFWKVEDPWIVTDLTAFYKTAERHMNEALLTIHILVDLSHARQIPPAVLSLRHSTTWRHPRSGQTAIAGASPLVQSLVKTIFRLVHFDRVQFFDNIDEARGYLLNLIDKESDLPATADSRG